jgi:hypothetical protein
MFDPGWDPFSTCQDKVGYYRTTTVEQAPPPRVFVPVKKVNPRARLEALRKARIAAHPDKGGSAAEFVKINAEYESLKRLLVLS